MIRFLGMLFLVILMALLGCLLEREQTVKIRAEVASDCAASDR